MQLAQDIAKAKVEGIDITGIWDFAWEKGSFTVEFRPGNVFYCEDYQAHAKWTIDGANVSIDWGKFGKYELVAAADGSSMDGHAKGDPKAWRKATKTRSLTDAEKAIMGSVWMFQYTGGEFEVEFHGDGHFNCPSYTAHSHWSMSDGDKLFINWGKFGKYTLTVDGEKKTMEGSVEGKPDLWRKGRYGRDIPPGTVSHTDHSG